MIRLAETGTADPNIAGIGEVCLLVTTTLTKKVVRRISIGLAEAFEASLRPGKVAP